MKSNVSTFMSEEHGSEEHGSEEHECEEHGSEESEEVPQVLKVPLFKKIKKNMTAVMAKNKAKLEDDFPEELK